MGFDYQSKYIRHINSASHKRLSVNDEVQQEDMDQSDRCSDDNDVSDGGSSSYQVLIVDLGIYYTITVYDPF